MLRPHLSRCGAVACALVAPIVCLAKPARAQTPPQQPAQAVDPRIATALGRLGYTFGRLIVTSATQVPSGSPPSADVQQAIDRMANRYTSTLRSTAALNDLLGSTLEVAYVGTDIVTAGTSLPATMTARWATKKGLDALFDHSRNEALGVLAANIDQLLVAARMDYESLKKAPLADVQRAIDRSHALDDLRKKLADQPEALHYAERAVVNTLRATDKSTLDRLAQTNIDVAATNTRLAELGTAVSAYVTRTDTHLKQIDEKLADVEQGLASAKRDIEALQTSTTITARQGQIIGEFVFGRASAQDRLQLLQNGYLEGVLDPSDRERLLQATEKEAKTERLIQDLSRIARQFNDVGQIARNLGIRSPELEVAISLANTAVGVTSSLAQGDILGAVAGLSSVVGLFGSRTDPSAERHRQLMSFLSAQFDQVNKRLDELIAGQQKILEGLVVLSQQMAAYNEQVNERLDRVTFRVDNIAAVANNILYSPLRQCELVRRDVLRTLKLDEVPRGQMFRSIQDVRSLRSVRRLPIKVSDCVDYLRGLYGVAFDNSGFSLDPLALRYWNTHASERPRDYANAVNEYRAKSNVEAFITGVYAPTVEFWRAQPVEVDVLWSLAGLTVPAKTTAAFRERMTELRSPRHACVRGTVLSEPLVGVLCRRTSSSAPPTRQNLEEEASPQLESSARKRALDVMASPLLHEGLVTLAEYALFLSPLYDLVDEESNRLRDTIDEILEDESTSAAGALLIEDALQATTVGLAQMNLVYGDATAYAIFQELWDDSTKSFRESDTTLVRQQRAITLFKQSGYLQRNVLMFALDRSLPHAGAGDEYAYEFARDLLERNEAFGQAQLRTLFVGNSAFSANCEAPASAPPTPQVSCVRQAYTTIHGVKVPLPSARDLRERALVYPGSLLSLVDVRNRLAARLADYRVLGHPEGQSDAWQSLVAAFIAIHR
jgi:hypothetical protein